MESKVDLLVYESPSGCQQNAELWNIFITWIGLSHQLSFTKLQKPTFPWGSTLINDSISDGWILRIGSFTPHERNQKGSFLFPHSLLPLQDFTVIWRMKVCGIWYCEVIIVPKSWLNYQHCHVPRLRQTQKPVGPTSLFLCFSQEIKRDSSPNKEMISAMHSFPLRSSAQPLNKFKWLNVFHFRSIRLPMVSIEIKSRVVWNRLLKPKMSYMSNTCTVSFCCGKSPLTWIGLLQTILCLNKPCQYFQYEDQDPCLLWTLTYHTKHLVNDNSSASPHWIFSEWEEHKWIDPFSLQNLIQLQVL